MPSIIKSIKQQLESLSAAEKQIAKYVIQNPDLIPNMTTKELSTKTGVSEASIVRFCKSIGMGSFKSFKLALVRDLTIAEMNITDVTNLKKNDSPYDLFQKVIQVNKFAIDSCTDSMNKKELDAAVATIKSAKKIVFFGVGGSSIAAVDAHYKFTRLGYHSITSTDFHYLLTVIPYLQKGDVFIAISTSGMTKDVIELAQFAQKTGATVIAITNLDDKSTLHRLADINLCTPNVEQDFRIGSIPSRMTQLTIIDTLYMSVFHQIGAKVIKHYHDARKEMEQLRR
ncbi:MurR/RpiR family transcriptional regulator [Sporosarcina jiandibaonis]|uniref:MurR/RpiR family transcriptional regulator n=1 Tax=Sporosarcina jiandibaonis TaxID=2715535 RepID=UPI0015575595|nr:MurR/RpiR family transcriptional regulator [Sporosarcina jiandibaonis]